MALVVCKDCGKEISDAAPSCPNCGRPNEAATPEQPKEAKPEMIKTNSSGGLGTLIVAAIILYFMWGSFFGGGETELTKEPPQKIAQSPKPSPAEKSPAKPTAKTFLEFNANSFKTAFNNAGKKINSPLKIGSIKVEKGEINDAFSVDVGEYVSIVGAIDKKSQKLIWLLTNGVGDSTEESAFQILSGIGQVITTFFPKLDAEGRGELLNKLDPAAIIKDRTPRSYVVNSLKLTLSIPPTGIIILGVEPAE